MWFEGASKGELEIVGDGSARWAMVHRDDLADAYVRAATSGISGEVFNVSEPSGPTVLDMARAVARATGYAGEVRRIPVAEAVARFGAFAECLAYDQQLDSTKAERLLGWQPRRRGFVEEVDVYFEAWKAGLEC
jgi:nucleoside-diphosphate-sugar epimerase